MLNLSEKQKLILDFLKSESLEKGYVTSVREIYERVWLKSTTMIHAHLNKLELYGDEDCISIPGNNLHTPKNYRSLKSFK